MVGVWHGVMCASHVDTDTSDQALGLRQSWVETAETRAVTESRQIWDLDRSGQIWVMVIKYHQVIKATEDMRHLGYLGISWDEGWRTLVNIGEHWWTLVNIGEHWWTLVNDVNHGEREDSQVLREDSLHRNHWSYLVSPSCHLHLCHLDSKSVHVAARREVHGMLPNIGGFNMFYHV